MNTTVYTTCSFVFIHFWYIALIFPYAYIYLCIIFKIITNLDIKYKMVSGMIYAPDEQG